MLGAGRLDRRITINRLTEGLPNGFGEPVETWAELATIWAMRADVSDGEKVATGQRSSALLSRFVVRSSTVTRTVSAADRITHGGATWNILGVKQTADGRDRYIEITAARESD